MVEAPLAFYSPKDVFNELLSFLVEFALFGKIAGILFYGRGVLRAFN